MTCCVVPSGVLYLATAPRRSVRLSPLLGLSATGLQRDWGSAPLGLSATGTQYDCGWVKKPDGSYFFLTVAKRVLFALK